MSDKGNGLSVVRSRTSSNCAGSLRRAGRAILFAGAIALALGATARVSSAADDTGQDVFKANCVVCHGEDGTGTATGKALMAPDLHSDAVQKLTDAQITDQISNGKNNMPPFKNTLSADQIKSLVTYVRTFGKKKK